MGKIGVMGRDDLIKRNNDLVRLCGNHTYQPIIKNPREFFEQKHGPRLSRGKIVLRKLEKVDVSGLGSLTDPLFGKDQFSHWTK